MRLDKAVLVILWAACLFGVGLPQSPQWAQRPELVSFEPWREMRRTEFAYEYEQQFPSAYRSGVPVNDLVRLKVMVPTEPVAPPPVVVLLHYWGATSFQLETSMGERLARRGIATVMLPMPYHLSRTPAGRRSGEMAVVPDPVATTATMTQATMDVIRAIDWIQSRPEFDHDQIGLGGTSLGAVVAALVKGVEPRVGPSAFLLGGVDLAGIVWRSSRLVLQRDLLRRTGYTEESLREALRSVEPLEYLQPTEEPALVIGARFDTVIPTDSTERLIERLGNPETLWIDTGHYGGVFVERQLVDTVSRFFEASLQGGEFRAPGRLFAPTIRVGLQLNPETGLQVGAGLDLWRSNARGDAFGSVMLTPRGVQGFLGAKVSRDFAIGISVLPKQTTFGAYWSVVI